MYSGTTLTKYSGKVLGAHQKFDKVSRKQLAKLMNKKHFFPVGKDILHFEGKNGPDAIKRKSPAQDEPWHYYSPFDEQDSQLIDLIKSHYKQLVIELRGKNKEKSAFEAAWLAHALVDGLTPAHHYPYEKKLSELSGGQPKELRKSIKQKLIVPGINRREKIKNNWKMWGPKGLFTTHGMFEMGIALIIAPLSLNSGLPSKEEIAEGKEIGLIEYFKRTAKEVAALQMYERYYESAWTPQLAREVRHHLAPSIVKTVTLGWYLALLEANKVK
jgi:hypothetical protein